MTRLGRVGLVVAVAGALLVGAGGCRRRQPSAPPPPRPALGAVEVELLGPSPDAPPPLDPEAFRAGLRERLLASGLFAPGGGEGGDGGASARTRVRATVAAEMVEAGEKGEARAQVRLRADTRPPEAPGAVSFDLGAQGNAAYAVGGDADKPDPGKVALRVAGDLVNGFAARARLRDGPPSAVHAALIADGGELREEAIRAVGQRKLKDEAPALLALLGDPDEATADAALGALIALGDRRAVTELAKTRSFRNRREMRKIIEAIAILGGQEADDYLSFVAATHDDDEIRAAAAAARARVARRADAGGGGAP